MASDDIQLLAVLPQFAVEDVQSTVNYYRDVLGFRVCELVGRPPTFAVVDRGAGRGFHFRTGKSAPHRKNGLDSWDAYIEVQGLEALHQELAKRGAKIVRGPTGTEHGMIELEVEDQNGYVLCFAEALGTIPMQTQSQP